MPPFLNTIRQHLESGKELTLVTPYGIASGIVTALDEAEGTFVFKSPAPKPFKLYLVDVLFVQEG